ncbi:hypothetical protein WJ542_31165 [Paraburkholderia sp. B3]|uniref:hypothetical protein n=1 Tax=Paraburkholderia sp. B3 TaxID=3134791 RepID=UPI003981D605
MDAPFSERHPSSRLMAARVLHDALAPCGTVACRPAARFAQAVERMVNGVVSHETYADTARAANASGVTPRQARRNLADAAACDASPLAALFPPELTTRAFEQRWNALNEAATFGVVTVVRVVAAPGTKTATIRRTPRTSERDDRLRAALSEGCIEWLATRAAEDAHLGERALISLSRRLGLDRSAVHEAAACLYAEPAADLEQCAAELAVSPRTLQRQLANDGLAFGVLRQAVRPRSPVSVCVARPNRLRPPPTPPASTTRLT